MWKNNLIKQIATSQENKSSHVGTINDNSNNNCKDSKRKAISEPNPDHTYLLTPWSRVLLEKLTGFAANQEIPCILWNPKVH
jgi:hypothetical protein